MKLTDILILGLSIVFLIIGIDQIMVFGFSHGYWAIMLTLVLFFIYSLRKSKRNEESQKGENILKSKVDKNSKPPTSRKQKK